MKKWKYIFDSEGSDFREAIRKADEKNEEKYYFNLLDSADKLITRAKDKIDNKNDLNELLNIEESIKMDRIILNNTHNVNVINENLNATLNSIYDLFDELRIWIGG